MGRKLLQHAVACFGVVALGVALNGCSESTDGTPNDAGRLPEDGATADAPLDGGASDQDAAVAEDAGATCGEPEEQLRPPLLEQLTGCAVFRGSIHISDTQSVAFPELAGLRSVLGTLSFFRNDRLVSLTGVENLETLGGFSVTSHAVLADLAGFAELRSIDGDVLISSNAALASLHGLEPLRATGSLQISGNGALVNLDALAALERVNGDLTIRDNAALPQAVAEAFAARVEVSGAVLVTGNRP